MKKTKRLIVIASLVIFVLAVLFILLSLLESRTTFLGRASGGGTIDATNSYVFASPLVAKTQGEKIRVTVFALSGEGRGVAGRGISLSCSADSICEGVDIQPVQPVTDSLGQAIFDVSSATAGKVEVVAVDGSQQLPQTVSLRFE